MNIQNTLLLDTLAGKPTERPPVWIMRQAGRILPQYRALRARLSGFKELVQTPDLAAEVTIQPIDELGVDAAIIFSDILVIPEAMGLDYEMIEKKGPWFPKTIQSPKDVANLIAGEDAAAKLTYVTDAIHKTVQGLQGRVPLIGFCGAPWTIMAYMVEGSGSKTFSKARSLLVKHPAVAEALLQKITDTSIAYLKAKIKAGVSVVQIFDSWGGILSPELYQKYSLPYMLQIAEAIDEVPVILFPKGGWHSLSHFNTSHAQAIGLDWTIPVEEAIEKLPHKILQGNMDPIVLFGDQEEVAAKTLRKLQAFPKGQHIFNLGHGVYPDTPLENVRHMVNTVKNYRYT